MFAFRAALLCAVIAVAFAGVVHLNGPTPMIRFDDDAVLTASCSDPPGRVTHLSVAGQVELVANVGQSITAHLSNVKSSCGAIRSIKEPCATSASDTLNFPPLFYCLWSVGAQSVGESGPTSATRHEVRASSGELLGFSVTLACPLPDDAAVRVVTGKLSPKLCVLLPCHPCVSTPYPPPPCDDWAFHLLWWRLSCRDMDAPCALQAQILSL